MKNFRIWSENAWKTWILWMQNSSFPSFDVFPPYISLSCKFAKLKCPRDEKCRWSFIIEIMHSAKLKFMDEEAQVDCGGMGIGINCTICINGEVFNGISLRKRGNAWGKARKTFATKECIKSTCSVLIVTSISTTLHLSTPSIQSNHSHQVH